MYEDQHNHLSSARDLYARRQYEAAAEEFRRFLDFRPDHANARVGLGDSLANMERDEQAVAEYREAARLAPDLVGAHLHLAEALVRLGQPEEAIRESRRAIEIDPGLQRAYYALGCALQGRDAWGEAASAYRTALSLEPTDATTVRALAAALAYDGKLEESESLYRQAIQMDASSVRGHCGLARVLLETRRFDEALGECKAAVLLDPEDYLSWYRLGQAYRFLAKSDRFKQNWEAARHAYQTALRICPDQPSAMAGLARALHSLGESREAEKILQRLLSANPDDTESRYLLADVQMAQKRWLASWRSIRRYVDLKEKQKRPVK